jgi:hypothetical protein
VALLRCTPGRTGSNCFLRDTGAFQSKGVLAGSEKNGGNTILKKAFWVTTALVLCGSTSFAGQEPYASPYANAQFISWYAAASTAGAKYRFTPRDESKVLYEQSASSGFSSYAVLSDNEQSSSGFCCVGFLAADDFIIPGRGTHKITAVYTPGVHVSGYAEPSSMAVTFYDKIKYNEKSGTTTVVLKSSCPAAPFTDVTGSGSMLIDLSSCWVGKFKAGHDYALAVQANSGVSGVYSTWAWQTNRNQIKRQALYFTYYKTWCNQQFTPIKTCFPETGYGPDLAFAIIGK